VVGRSCSEAVRKPSPTWVEALQPNAPATIVGHLPRPRADFSAVTIGSTAYLVGGYDGTNAALDVLATTDGATFRTVARLPVGVRYPAVAALGHAVYVFGGESAQTASSAIQRIDLQTGQARVVGQMSQPRTQASALAIGGSIYIAGGRVGGASTPDVLRFEPTSVRLVAVGQLPAPVSDAATAVNGNIGYLVGGEANAPMSSVMLLQPTNAAPSSHYTARMARPFVGRLVIADRGNNRLIVVNANKQVSWTYPSATMPPPAGGFYYPDDAFFADHGRSILTNQEENHTIVHLGFPSGTVLWSYGHPKVPGSSAGYLNQPDDAFLLSDGSISVADAKNCRILFINAQRQPTVADRHQRRLHAQPTDRDRLPEWRHAARRRQLPRVGDQRVVDLRVHADRIIGVDGAPSPRVPVRPATTRARSLPRRRLHEAGWHRRVHARRSHRVELQADEWRRHARPSEPG